MAEDYYRHLMSIYIRLDRELRTTLSQVTAQALATDLTAAQQAMTLKRIEEILRANHVKLSALEGSAVPAFWADQQAIAKAQLARISIRDGSSAAYANPATWSQMDEGAIRAVAHDMANTRARFLGTIPNAPPNRNGSVLRQIDDYLRVLGGQQIPRALAGEPLYQVGMAIREGGINLLRQGKDIQTIARGLDRCLGVTYANGSFHSLHAYGQMSARTGVMRARTESSAEAFGALDIHLFRVSEHGTICPLCLPFEGTVWAMDETGVAAGYQRCPVYWPRHPNCGHSIIPYLGTPEEAPPKNPPAVAFEDDAAQRAWLKENHPEWYQAGRQGFGTQAEWQRAKIVLHDGEGLALSELRGPRYRYRNIEERRIQATANMLKDPGLSYSSAMASVTQAYMDTPAYAKLRATAGEISPTQQRRMVEENWPALG